MGSREDGIVALRRFLAKLIASHEDALTELQASKAELARLGWQEHPKMQRLREEERAKLKWTIDSLANTVGVTRAEIESARLGSPGSGSPFVA